MSVVSSLSRIFANGSMSYRTTPETLANSHHVMLNDCDSAYYRDSHPLATRHSCESVSFFFTSVLWLMYFCFCTSLSVLQRFPLARILSPLPYKVRDKWLLLNVCIQMRPHAKRSMDRISIFVEGGWVGGESTELKCSKLH